MSRALTSERALGSPVSDALVVWHLLSLDAPTVATLWTLFIARAMHATVSLATLLAMFLAVWVLYSGDRLLDARVHRPYSSEALEPRHLFHRRHRRGFIHGIVLATAVLIPLLGLLPAACLVLYLLLALILGGWFAAIHLIAAKRSLRLPKELAVGFFFSAAVFAPTLAGSPPAWRTLLAPAILFGNLASLNCLFIFRWEHEETSQGAHPSTQFGLRVLKPLTMLSVIAPILLITQTAVSCAPILVATSLSAGLLCLLHTDRAGRDATLQRALADAALLTPLILLPGMR